MRYKTGYPTSRSECHATRGCSKGGTALGLQRSNGSSDTTLPATILRFGTDSMRSPTRTFGRRFPADGIGVRPGFQEWPIYRRANSKTKQKSSVTSCTDTEKRNGLWKGKYLPSTGRQQGVVRYQSCQDAEASSHLSTLRPVWPRETRYYSQSVRQNS